VGIQFGPDLLQSLLQSLLPVVGVSLIAIVLFGFAVLYKKWKNISSSSISHIDAHLIGKRQQATGQEIQLNGEHTVIAPLSGCFVIFEPVGGGERQEFQVSYEIYHSLAQGECGRLEFQGSRFVDFHVKDNSKTQTKKSKRRSG